MMAMEYIDNEAKLDGTSACTITSPPFAISPDFKNFTCIWFSTCNKAQFKIL